MGPKQVGETAAVYRPYHEIWSALGGNKARGFYAVVLLAFRLERNRGRSTRPSA